MMMAKQAADQNSEIIKCSRALSDLQSQNDLENASASCKRHKIDEDGAGVIVELSKSSMSTQITNEKCTSIFRFLLKQRLIQICQIFQATLMSFATLWT